MGECRELGWEKRLPSPGKELQTSSAAGAVSPAKIQHFEVKEMAKRRNSGAIPTF